MDTDKNANQAQMIYSCFGAYFHQDAFSDGQTVEDIIDEIKKGFSRSRLDAIIHAITDRLADEITEADLLAMGCYADPKDWSMTEKQWVSWIVDLLKS